MRRITLMQFLIEAERRHSAIHYDLRLLLEVVSRACKAISIAIGKGGRVTGYHARDAVPS